MYISSKLNDACPLKGGVEKKNENCLERFVDSGYFLKD